MYLSDRSALRRAVALAKLELSSDQSEQLLRELDDVLKAFSKMDTFKETVEEEPLPIVRPFRKDQARPCDFDPFSNTRLVENRRFLAPRLVD